MAELSSQQWQDYSEAVAFVGNSLLGTMHQTSELGLNPEFWKSFLSFENSAVEQALHACCAFAEQAQAHPEVDWATEASVDYTHLFVGPPKPAAAPWETFYAAEGVSVGFGQATFEMRQLLREAGLQLENENNQYEDHMGIELLLLSVYSGRVAAGEMEPQAVVDYVAARPGAWVGKFYDAVAAASPEGYMVCIVGLAKALLAVLQS